MQLTGHRCAPFFQLAPNSNNSPFLYSDHKQTWVTLWRHCSTLKASVVGRKNFNKCVWNSPDVSMCITYSVISSGVVFIHALRKKFELYWPVLLSSWYPGLQDKPQVIVRRKIPLLSTLPVSNYRRWSQHTIHSFSSTTFCWKIREDNYNFWGHTYASCPVVNSTSLLPWIFWRTRRWWNITLGQQEGDTLLLEHWGCSWRQPGEKAAWITSATEPECCTSCNTISTYEIHLVFY